MLSVCEPVKPFEFEIKSQHTYKAKRNDACNCVVARALQDKGKEKLLEVHVLATVTVLIWSGGKCCRYRTPGVLRRGLEHFDKTGKWNLKPGKYQLAPICDSQTRSAQSTRALLRRFKDTSYSQGHYPHSGTRRAASLSPRLLRLREKHNSAG
jgi:hypothetical protein